MSATHESCTSSAHLKCHILRELKKSLQFTFSFFFYLHMHIHTQGDAGVIGINKRNKQMVVIEMKHADNRFTFSVDLMGEIKSRG